MSLYLCTLSACDSSCSGNHLMYLCVCVCAFLHCLLWMSPLCPCPTLQEQPPQVIGDVDLSIHSQCTLWVSLSILSMGL